MIFFLMSFKHEGKCSRFYKLLYCQEAWWWILHWFITNYKGNLWNVEYEDEDEDEDEEDFDSIEVQKSKMNYVF